MVSRQEHNVRSMWQRCLLFLLPPLTVARGSYRLLLTKRRSNRLLRLRVYIDAHLREMRWRPRHLMSIWGFVVNWKFIVSIILLTQSRPGRFMIQHNILVRFPNPKALVNELHLNGFKAIWMLDQGIKHEKGYFVYDSGSKEDVWIQNVDGKPFFGTQWLHRRVEVDGNEEYSEVEYSPARCTGEYTVIERNFEQEGGDKSLKLEGDIGGGLVLQRQI
ncbi:hypothetical protein Syun_031697 [Stephania yunnanensis]|uniref:Glycoside hydrolase family 31 TIM barrel domain-containing protein n=1 Tax=Stephania yunnanensis TaxID=152371 RepID=A0AAP0HCS4_9MAGN